MIPQWALGWHQCKFGYEDTQALKDVVANYSSSEIPLEVMWSDIDYLYNYRDFTYDHIRYAELPAFIEELHSKSMYYIPIIDAGVAIRPWGDYQAYSSGKEKDVFIKYKDN